MKFKKIDDGHLVRCDIGDEIISTVTDFLKDSGLKSGIISGIGAVKNLELGYFDFNSKEYKRKKFDGIYELLNLTGNYTILDDSVMLHCHITIADKNYNVYGGHLFSGIIAVTGEFFIKDFGLKIHRGKDDIIGLNLIKL